MATKEINVVQDAKTLRYRTENTLDIIESILNHTYSIRRKSLAQRIKRASSPTKNSNEIINSITSRALSPDKNNRTHNNYSDNKQNNFNSSNREIAKKDVRNPHRTSENKIQEEDDDDYEDEILNQMSSKFLHNTKVAPIPKNNISIPAPINVSIARPPPITGDSKPVNIQLKHTSPTNRQMKQKQERTLEEVRECFRVDYNNVLQQCKNVVDEEELEMICESLIDKYFVKELDKRELTPEVAALRREIGEYVDQLGNLEFNEMPSKNFSQQNSNHNHSAVDGQLVNNQMRNDSTQSQQVKPTTVDTRQTEKQKIKEQYEEYLALKKKTHQHADVKTIEEMESLNEDIKSVLQSIQGLKTK